MTIKQLDKQIETANKRIAGYQGKIEMYLGRTNNACAAAKVSINDIITTENGRPGHRFYDYQLPASTTSAIGFEASYRITNNYRSMKENERLLEREKRTLASLIEQREKMISDANNYANATAGLSVALEHAMVDFRAVWFRKMREWYKNHYEYINEKLPVALDRYKRADECRRYFSRTRGWSWCRTSRLMKWLENVCKATAEITMDDAARMDFDAYMDAMEQAIIKSWENGIKVLTDKCYKFGLNESAIRVNQPSMTGKGFSAIITDGTARVIDIRVIWAAEFSSIVTPHTRYIATQRTK